MKKWVPWFLVLVISTLAGCCVHSSVKHPAERMTPVEVTIDKTVALVKFIHVVEDEVEETTPDAEDAKMVPYCAGVWVSKDVVVTAAHCVEDLGRPPVPPKLQILHQLFGVPLPPWDPTGQPLFYATHNDVRDEHGKRFRSHHDAKVLAFDKEHDLALVQAESSLIDFPIPNHATAKLATDVKVGDDLEIVGHPKGMWWTYIRGVTSAIRIEIKNADDHPVDAVQVSAPVWFGNSGGGAFNSNGELVGICSWIRNVPNTSFFIHRDHVAALLKKHKVGR